MNNRELILFLSEANGNIRTMDDDSYVDYCVTIAPDLAQEVFESRKTIEELRKEIYTLRLYGNKDCTAMADDLLERAQNE